MMPLNDITVAVPADVASATTALVRAGEFQSEGDVVRAVVEEWRVTRAPVDDALASRRRDIAHGLVDVAFGRDQGLRHRKDRRAREAGVPLALRLS